MKKTMLIGDSIRMGYEPRVRELLEGKADVHSPGENCRFSAYTLFNVGVWAADDDYDVIHWNNGQWDTCYMPDGRIHTPLLAYVELQKRIATILQSKGKRLVFATTTPVRPGQFEAAERNGRRTEDIVAYNACVTAELSAMDVEINDLFTPVSAAVMELICDDNVHLSPAGVEVCAERVAAVVLA